MIIEVDCNNDRVSLQGSSFKITDGNVNFKVKDPITILKMLEEIFTAVADGVDGGLNVQLLKLDEDTRTTIGEW